MIYDVDIVYEANLLTVQLGNSQIILSSDEDLFANFQGWGYVGLTGFHRGTARKMVLESALICEDNLSSNYVYKWIYNNQVVNSKDITVPVGASINLSILFLDAAGKYLPHYKGLSLYDWNISVSINCGGITFVNPPANLFELMFTVNSYLNLDI